MKAQASFEIMIALAILLAFTVTFLQLIHQTNHNARYNLEEMNKRIKSDENCLVENEHEVKVDEKQIQNGNYLAMKKCEK
jgi:hypothetical protein